MGCRANCHSVALHLPVESALNLFVLGWRYTHICCMKRAMWKCGLQLWPEEPSYRTSCKELKSSWTTWSIKWVCVLGTEKWHTHTKNENTAEKCIFPSSGCGRGVAAANTSISWAGCGWRRCRAGELGLVKQLVLWLSETKGFLLLLLLFCLCINVVVTLRKNFAIFGTPVKRLMERKSSVFESPVWLPV